MLKICPAAIEAPQVWVTVWELSALALAGLAGDLPLGGQGREPSPE